MHYTVCDYWLECLANAAEAGAHQISTEWREQGSSLTLRVEDNGPGIPPEIRDTVMDPFYSDGKKHPGRKAGLGLPFLKQLTDSTGGTLTLNSGSSGTTILFTLDLSHVDTPPAGDIVTTLITAFTMPGDYDLSATRTVHEHSYTITRTEIIDALGDLDDVYSLTLLKQFIQDQEQELIQ